MKGEPEWLRDVRLRSFEIFEQMSMPDWGGDLSEIVVDDVGHLQLAAPRLTVSTRRA